MGVCGRLDHANFKALDAQASQLAASEASRERPNASR